jgi:hypothetical protein
MNFLEFPLNHQNAGTGVEVTLEGVESDVFLVDDSNLSSFKRGGQFRYLGGHYEASPVVLGVPLAGNWTVVVVPGPGGTVRASARTLN